MPVRIVEDPVGDPRWSELLERHPAASIFHSPGWLSALQKTYGYEPFVVTTSPGPTLENGLAVCRVKGWMSRRLVSLPFSDHCAPLVDRPSELSEILARLTCRSAHGRLEIAGVAPSRRRTAVRQCSARCRPRAGQRILPAQTRPATRSRRRSFGGSILPAPSEPCAGQSARV